MQLLALVVTLAFPLDTDATRAALYRIDLVVVVLTYGASVRVERAHQYDKRIGG